MYVCVYVYISRFRRVPETGRWRSGRWPTIGTRDPRGGGKRRCGTQKRVRRNFSKAVPQNTLYSYLDPKGNESNGFFRRPAFSPTSSYIHVHMYIYIHIFLFSAAQARFKFSIYISSPRIGERNIHPRVATTGSQRCGITGRIKNQYFR